MIYSSNQRLHENNNGDIFAILWVPGGPLHRMSRISKRRTVWQSQFDSPFVLISHYGFCWHTKFLLKNRSHMHSLNKRTLSLCQQGSRAISCVRSATAKEWSQESKDLANWNKRLALEMELGVLHHSPGYSKSIAIMKRTLMFALLIGVTVPRLGAAKHPTLEANVDAAKCLECHADKTKEKVVHSTAKMGCLSCHEVRVSKDITRVKLITATPRPFASPATRT